MSKKRISILLVIICIALFILFQPKTDPIISISLSTDGHYAISGHAPRKTNSVSPKGQMVLWDIQKKTKTILSDNANSFSALFIPDSHEFMWQDQNDIMHVQNVEGKELEIFKHPHVQNHRITADKSFYLSVDFWGNIYKGYGDTIQPVYTDGSPTRDPYSLSIVNDYFLSVTDTCHGDNDPVAETNLTVNPVNPTPYKKSSYDGVTLWDKNTLKPIAKLNGNCGATSGLISPDGKWVFAGGENLLNYMWSTDNLNTRLELQQVDDSVIYRDAMAINDKSPIPVPKKYDGKQITLNHTVAIAFLTEKDFILLNNTNTDELRPLYTTGSPLIKGYVETGRPYISTDYFQRNLSVSSSPSAHILVTGQATGGGINVYKYHPETKTLEKIWVAD